MYTGQPSGRQALLRLIKMTFNTERGEWEVCVGGAPRLNDKDIEAAVGGKPRGTD